MTRWSERQRWSGRNRWTKDARWVNRGRWSSLVDTEVTPSIPSNVSAPVISGNGAEGQTLSCSTGSWTGSPTPTFTYQWYANAVLLTGETNATYVVSGTQGQATYCKVTATNSEGSDTADSNTVTYISNTVAPVVSGNAGEGGTLTTTDGTWSGSTPISYAYQWYANSSPIAGQTTNTYVVSGTAGQDIYCEVTASNTISSVPQDSNTVAFVVNTVAPVVTGTASEGGTLSSTTGTWTGTATITYSYQWYANLSPIVGQISSTYVVSGTEGDDIYCEVTATNDYGSDSEDSNTVAFVVNTVAPVVTGSAAEAGVLSTTNGTWTGSATISYSYQWYANASPISGQTSSTYTVSGTEGDNIFCRVTATNAVGNDSADSNTVAFPVNTVAPVATGSVLLDEVLSTTNGTWTGSATLSYSYQWYSDASPISGATSSTFTVTASEVGTTVYCEVTATNAVGSDSANSNSLVESAGWDPIVDDTGTLGHFDSTDNTRMTNPAGELESWTDRSDSLTVSQATPSARPDTNATANGEQVVTFDGGDELTGTVDWGLSGDITVMWYGDVTSVSFFEQAFFSTSGSNTFQVSAGNASQFNGAVYFGGPGTSGNFTGGPYESPAIFEVYFDSTAGMWYALVNGTQVATNNYTTDITGSQTFNFAVSSGQNRNLDCVMGDVVMSNSIDSTNRTGHREYMATKFGVTLP